MTVVAADPGPAATVNAGEMTEEILPPALRPPWDQFRQGVTRPVAEAVTAPLIAATSADLAGTTGVIAGSAGERDTVLRVFVTPEVTEAVHGWIRRLLAP